MNFSSLPLHETIVSALTEINYIDTTPVQAQAIPLILQGRDIMASAQTGTGKTAAFTLPILHNLQNTYEQNPAQAPSIKALILTPTRELAMQVFQSVEKYGRYTQIKCALAYGGVSINPQIEAIKAGAQILVATPGRLLDHIIKGSVTLNKLNTLVLDEADRMLDMGFKDEINNILKRVPAKRQTLLFSATFDDNVIKLSRRLLLDPKTVSVDSPNSTATDVEQIVYNIDEDRKRELTSYLIGSKNWQQVLIFTRTKQSADALVKEMAKDGLKTAAIHGDKAQGTREKALLDFKQGNIRALVATDIAARGLDIADLGVVINYELPFKAEDYIHRIGRTGRAGKNGLAISLMSIDEEWLLNDIETLLDERLNQQWLPGYEPDLTKKAKSLTNSKRSARSSEKQQTKKRLMARSKKQHKTKKF